MNISMSSTACNAQFAKNHKAKLLFEPDSFILVSRKAKIRNLKVLYSRSENVTGPKTSKKIYF